MYRRKRIKEIDLLRCKDEPLPYTPPIKKAKKGLSLRGEAIELYSEFKKKKYRKTEMFEKFIQIYPNFFEEDSVYFPIN